jgi:hypothetical protein
MYVDWKTRTISISISIWRTVYGGIQLLWHLCKYHKIAEEEKENYHLSDHSNKKRSAAAAEEEEQEVTKKKKEPDAILCQNVDRREEWKK